MTAADRQLLTRHANEYARLIGAPTKFRHCKSATRPNRLNRPSQRDWDSRACRSVREAVMRIGLGLGLSGLQAAQAAQCHPLYLRRGYSRDAQ